MTHLRVLGSVLATIGVGLLIACIWLSGMDLATEVGITGFVVGAIGGLVFAAGMDI
jgi:hypothetical protein